MPKFKDYLFGGIGSKVWDITKNKGVSEWLFGKEASTERKSFQTPQQEQLFNQLLGGLGGQGGGGNQAMQYLQQYLNPNQEQGFQQFANPYLQNFEEQGIPRIAERFAGQGANSGALSSSGFAQALGGARAGLQGELAQQYGNRQMQSSNTLLSLLQNLLGQQTFGYQQNEANPGLVASGLTAFAGGLGKGIGGGGFG